MPEIRTHPETGKKVIFYSLGEDVPVAAGQQVYTTPNGNYIEIPDTGTQYVEGSYQRKDFTQPQLEASKDILMERGLLPYAAGRTINNLDLARERDRKILYEQSLKRTSPEPQNIANVMLPGGVQGLLGPLVEKVGRRFADTKSAQSQAINQFAAAGQASPSVVPDNRTTPDQLTAIQTYPDTNQFQNVFVNSNEYGNANTLVAGNSDNPFSRSYVAGQGIGISNALRDQGGTNTLSGGGTTSDGPMFRTYGLMNFPSGRNVSGDGSGGGGGMFGVSSIISPNIKKDENQIALDKNQAEVADKVIEQVKTEEAKQGGGKQSSEELEKLKNEILASDVDPYRWQNFFANAAIAFNTLRMPSMRDQQLPAIMADRIKTNRALYQTSKTAKFFEKDYPEIANMVRTGALEPKDALTYITKVGDASKLTEAINTRLQAAKILNLTPGTPEYNSVISGGKPTDPNATAYERRASARKEFNSMDSIKDFRSVRSAYGRILASADKPSAAGDLALIFNYMKMLDPGSVVRESEFRTAQQAKAWFINLDEESKSKVPNFVRTFIQGATEGTMLLPAQREDFKSRAEALYDDAENIYLNTRKQYDDIAIKEKYLEKGDSLFIDERYTGKNRTYAPPEVGDTSVGDDGSIWRYVGGDPNNEKNWVKVQ